VFRAVHFDSRHPYTLCLITRQPEQVHQIGWRADQMGEPRWLPGGWPRRNQRDFSRA